MITKTRSVALLLAVVLAAASVLARTEALDQDMPTTVTDILGEALRLEPDAPAEVVAAEGLASLDRPADPDVQSAWDAAIERRIEIERREIRLELWVDVKPRIDRDLLRR
jgi:hypothetical protein